MSRGFDPVERAVVDAGLRALAEADLADLVSFLTIDLILETGQRWGIELTAGAVRAVLSDAGGRKLDHSLVVARLLDRHMVAPRFAGTVAAGTSVRADAVETFGSFLEDETRAEGRGRRTLRVLAAAVADTDSSAEAAARRVFDGFADQMTKLLRAVGTPSGPPVLIGRLLASILWGSGVAAHRLRDNDEGEAIVSAGLVALLMAIIGPDDVLDRDVDYGRSLHDRAADHKRVIDAALIAVGEAARSDFLAFLTPQRLRSYVAVGRSDLQFYRAVGAASPGEFRDLLSSGLALHGAHLLREIAPADFGARLPGGSADPRMDPAMRVELLTWTSSDPGDDPDLISRARQRAQALVRALDRDDDQVLGRELDAIAGSQMIASFTHDLTGRFRNVDDTFPVLVACIEEMFGAEGDNY